MQHSIAYNTHVSYGVANGIGLQKIRIISSTLSAIHINHQLADKLFLLNKSFAYLEGIDSYKHRLQSQGVEQEEIKRRLLIFKQDLINAKNGLDSDGKFVFNTNPKLMKKRTTRLYDGQAAG